MSNEVTQIDTDNESCETCRYYFNFEYGECRRYPPTWPPVHTRYWCGEWQQRKDERKPLVKLKESDIENSPAQPKEKETFSQMIKEILCG